MITTVASFEGFVKHLVQPDSETRLQVTARIWLLVSQQRALPSTEMLASHQQGLAYREG